MDSDHCFRDIITNTFHFNVSIFVKFFPVNLAWFSVIEIKFIYFVTLFGVFNNKGFFSFFIYMLTSFSFAPSKC